MNFVYLLFTQTPFPMILYRYICDGVHSVITNFLNYQKICYAPSHMSSAYFYSAIPQQLQFLKKRKKKNRLKKSVKRKEKKRIIHTATREVLLLLSRLMRMTRAVYKLSDPRGLLLMPPLLTAFGKRYHEKHFFLLCVWEVLLGFTSCHSEYIPSKFSSFSIL